MKRTLASIAIIAAISLLSLACNALNTRLEITPTYSPLKSPVGTSSTSHTNPNQEDIDGTGRLLFTFDASGKFQIGIMNMTDGKITALTNSSGPGDADPSWTADGTSILFITGRTRQNDFEIYRMNADGSDQQLVITAPSSPAGNFAPELSPDGKTLVFQTNRGGNLEIYTSNAEGTGQKNISNNPANDVTPSWSPDGTKLVFASDRTGEYQLYTMNPDGSNVKLLFKHPGQSDIRPHYSPNGYFIVFGTQPTLGGNSQVAVINPDGTGYREISISPGMATQGAWMGNDSILFSAREDDLHKWQLYMMKLNSRYAIRLTHMEANFRNPTWAP